MAPYLHQTQGRIRVRSDYILQNPHLVKQTIEQLEKQPGIQDINHRYHAGSVAIHFDHNVVDAGLLLSKIQRFGWLASQKEPKKTGTFDHFLHNGARMVVKGVLVNQLKRSWQGALLVTMLNQWVKI